MAATVVLALGGCASKTHTLPNLQSPQDFAQRIQKAKFGCRDLVVQPRKRSDKPSLVALASCHIQQSIAVPSKKDLQKLVDQAKKGEPTTSSVAGPIGLFLYRNEKAATEAVKGYINYICSPPVHPAQVDYYAGKNFWVLSADSQVEVLTALDSVFGNGTVHEAC